MTVQERAMLVNWNYAVVAWKGQQAHPVIDAPSWLADGRRYDREYAKAVYALPLGWVPPHSVARGR
jgi:hypothetical protein